MRTLREFIAIRRDEIKQQIAALRAELRELDTAEAALPPLPADDDQRSRGASRNMAGERRSGGPTIKQMVQEVLQDHLFGADAQMILDRIKERFNADIARQSLSPQLSRLKEEGILELDGRMWKLARRNSEGPDVGASGPSSIGAAAATDQDLDDLLGPAPATSSESPAEDDQSHPNVFS